MKKIAYLLIALTTMVFTFTSCSDVPMPYEQPSIYDDGSTSKPEGDGSAANPFNIAAAVAKCKEVGNTLSEEKYYIKGYVTKATTADAAYGNATFTMSDDAEGNGGSFTAYQIAGNNGDKLTAGYAFNVGDIVTIYGKIYNYNNNTPETEGKGAAWLIAHEKSGSGGGGGSTETMGTPDNPLSVADALKIISGYFDKQVSEEDAYVKGKIVAISTSDPPGNSYGNASYDIADEGSTEILTVFRGYNLGNTKFTSSDDIKVGDEVIVLGKLTLYGTKPEIAKNNYIYSLNGKTAEGGESGGGSDTPSASGDGTKDSPYSVSAAQAAGDKTGAYMKGYIVGFVSGQVYADGATFSAEGAVASNVLLADSPNETDASKCMPIQLPTGAVRTALNLKDNAGNLKKEVTLYGDLTKYFGQAGLKNVTFAILNGTEIGTNPDGGGESGGGDTGGMTYDFTQSQGNWTIVNAIALPEALSAVWTQTSNYGMKATAFLNNQRYETDSWLISPALTISSAATMTFNQAQRYAASGCTDLHVMVSSKYTGGTINPNDWTEVTPNSWPDGTNWNYIESTATIPAGTKYVAFRYTSTTATAATWEIKTVSIQ